jgi:hypothetical protein
MKKIALLTLLLINLSLSFSLPRNQASPAIFSVTKTNSSILFRHTDSTLTAIPCQSVASIVSNADPSKIVSVWVVQQGDYDKIMQFDYSVCGFSSKSDAVDSLTAWAICDTSSGGVGVGDVSQSALEDSIDRIQAAINTKQNTLVSGSNLKTLNNQTLLGSTNILTSLYSRNDWDSIRVCVNGTTDTVVFGYAVRSIALNGGGDSIIFYTGNIRGAIPISTGGGGSGWSLTGDASTDSAANFIGTTDTKPLSIRTNNNTVVKIDTQGKIGVGNTAPISTFHVSGSQVSSLSNVFTLAPKLSNLKFNTSFDMIDSSLYIGLNSYFNTAGAWLAAQTVASYIKASSTGLIFSVSSGNTINGAYTNSATTKAITLFANGNTTIGGTFDFGYRLNSNCNTNGFDGMFVHNSSSGSSAKAGCEYYNGNGNQSTRISKPGTSFATTDDRSCLLIENGETTGIKLHAVSSSGNIRFFLFNSEVFRLHSNGNIGIGTATPVASAALEISSTTKGFLPPRMTATQASAISSPAQGLMLFVTDTNGTFTSVGWWGYNGSTWEKLNN